MNLKQYIQSLILLLLICIGCDSERKIIQLRGIYVANHGYCGEKIIFDSDSTYTHVYGEFDYSKKSTYSIHNNHVYLKEFDDLCDWIKGGSLINDDKTSIRGYTIRDAELRIGIYEMGFTLIQEN